MIKKTIKYTDYDGNERVEDFYFNLTKAELIEMNFSEKGGLEKLVQKIAKTEDHKRLIELFKELILCSYGEKSDDGKRFIKTQELRDNFSQTEAFSELFMEFATSEDSVTDFVNGITPIIPQDHKLSSNK